MGHQKQGLLGIGREVFGSGDVKANLPKKTTQNQNKKQRTKNKEQRTKNKEQRTKNKKQPQIRPNNYFEKSAFILIT
ncbi:MAG TPA: hypothetical protein ENN08_03465 [Bacteroidales bacterium]|nr:hypothetical protein [Bacteroidales bacterium]